MGTSVDRSREDGVASGAGAAKTGEGTMKAMVRRRYGSPDVVETGDVAKPALEDDRVLVRVRAASVNPYDWHMMTGKPYLARLSAGLPRPKNPILGSDFAGTVEAVGKGVKEFKPGDEVFGGTGAAYAEYTTALERQIVHKPANVSFVEAAAVPMASLTAIQAMRDKGNLKGGDRVLINGASGGVGTYAVQIAKSLGAEVTGVCSTRNVEMVRGLGADHVVDYTRENFTESERRYDLILDIVSSQSLSACRRVLAPEGTYVAVGSEKKGNWIGPLLQVAKIAIASRLGSQTMVSMLARGSKEDLTILQQLLASGEISSVIDRTFPLSEGREALRYQGDGHAQGKTVITM